MTSTSTIITLVQRAASAILGTIPEAARPIAIRTNVNKAQSNTKWKPILKFALVAIAGLQSPVQTVVSIVIHKTAVKV